MLSFKLIFQESTPRGFFFSGEACFFEWVVLIIFYTIHTCFVAALLAITYSYSYVESYSSDWRVDYIPFRPWKLFLLEKVFTDVADRDTKRNTFGCPRIAKIGVVVCQSFLPKIVRKITLDNKGLKNGAEGKTPLRHQ